MEETSKCPFPECLKLFSNCYNLKKHINSHHLKIKPFKCSFCSKTFGYKHSMLHHQISHELAEKDKYTGTVLSLNFCALLLHAKDTDLRPFAHPRVKRLKRKRAAESRFELLPEITGEDETSPLPPPPFES